MFSIFQYKFCTYDRQQKQILAQSNYESVNSKNNEVSYLYFDQFCVLRLVAFTDGVNQSRLSTSRNPTIGITGPIVGCSIIRPFSTVFLATIQFRVQLGSTEQLQR